MNIYGIEILMKDVKKKEPRFHGEVSEKSHKNMSRIRGKDTNIEVTLRKALWNRGYRYRKNMKNFPGRPDIALTNIRLPFSVIVNFFMEKIGKF